MDDGDSKLGILLGDQTASEAYVAPIVSAGEVVALLYADNLPAGTSLGDTSALEVVLHHAGLALDRAVLERALAEMENQGDPPGDPAGGALDPAEGVRSIQGSPPAASRIGGEDR